MAKFKNKYRSESTRLQSWDYGNNGAYFITICTANRLHYFGEIEDKAMQLNPLGALAEKYWLEIPNHFPFILLKNFVVMPNHMHGVLVIDQSLDDGDVNGLDVDGRDDLDDDDMVDDDDMDVDTRLIAYLPNNAVPNNVKNDNAVPNNNNNNITNNNPPTQNKNIKKTGGITGEKNPMFHKNISRVIRWYKGRCTFEMRKIQPDFAWQARFHDHIIRNAISFQNIQNYIANNPANWNKDKFHK